MIDHFRVKQFHGRIEGRSAEHKLKQMGIQAILSGLNELYVPVGCLLKAIKALGLPPEIVNERQPGPWCRRCGHQLILKDSRLSRIKVLINCLQRWHCYGCDDEVKYKASAERLRKAVKRYIVSKGYHTKPDFIIIGAQKAGTSALFEILQQHPQIVAANEKELRFFDDYPKMHYGDFLSYHQMFPLPISLRPDKLTFEASPSYLFNKSAAQRIFDYSPKIRLIASLRDPISRAFSAWKMHQRFAKSTNENIRLLGDKRSFHEAIREELQMFETTAWEKDLFAYIKRGLYAEQLERYMKYFSADSLLILEHSMLQKDPQNVFNEVFRFLKIDDKFEIKPLRVNYSHNDETIQPAARLLLESFYKPHNQRLFTLIGKEYDW